MRPLTLDDLLPLDEYASRRREFFDAHRRYLDRYRRVRIGPLLMLLFENRQTLWFRVQELLRIARLSDPVLIQQELDLYNRLLPEPDCLQAALLIEITDESHLLKELLPWRPLRGDELQLCLGEMRFPARLITCRPEDHCIGTAHWIRFSLDDNGRRLLADFNAPAFVVIDHSSYQHASLALTEDIRQSLLDDLGNSVS